MSFSISKEIAEALGFRLELRYAFLRAIELAGYRKNPGSMKTPWIEMKAILSHICESHKLGKPVPDSFSAKLQSKLTSTMPPRPIVMVSFEDASAHLKRLFDDGLEVINVLNYSDTQSLMVCQLDRPIQR